MSKTWQNPYNFRFPTHNTEAFFGRAEEIAQLRRVISDNPVVYGEHRIGLTSFLRHFNNIAKELPEFKDFCCTYIDLRKVEPRTDASFFLFLTESVVGELPESQRKAFLDNPEPSGNLYKLIGDCLKETNVVFCLDEMDILYEFDNPHMTLGRIHFLGQHQKPKIRFVLGCSNYLAAIEQAHGLSAWDSWFHIDFTPIKLSVLSLSAAIQLIEQPSKKIGMDLSALKDFLLKLAGTHPMFLQMACFCAIETIRLMPDNKDNSLKTSIEHMFIENALPIYEDFWKSLSAKQQRLLQRIATKNIKASELFLEEESYKILNSGYVLRDPNSIFFVSEYFRRFVRNKALINHRDNLSFRKDKSMRENLLTDTVTLIKSNGEQIEGIKASVQSKKIFIADSTLPIEEGDKFERTLPSGLSEVFVVTNRGFFAGKGSIKSHYQVEVRRESAEGQKPAVQNITYNLQGQNPRVNVHSVDKSENTANINKNNVFAELRQTIKEKVNNKEEIDKLLKKISELEDTSGTKTFQEKYIEFMALAANHMTLVAPFLPALAQMLS